MNLEVLFTPAEFEALAARDLGGTTCVVFDVLRATTSMIMALEHGAEAIRPVAEIHEAVALKRRDPALLLAGERNGLRIRRDLTGEMDFDLGNSPREFTRAVVGGRRMAMTTTNGTRALRACAAAQRVFPGSVRNLEALTRRLLRLAPDRVTLICAGTHESAAYEDVIGAGALCQRLKRAGDLVAISDSAAIALDVHRSVAADPLTAVRRASNARRLLSLGALAEDVAYCLAFDASPVVAVMRADGWIVQD